MNFTLNTPAGNFVPGASVSLVVIVWILTAIVHIGFAIAVQTDSRMLGSRLRRHTFFVGGGLWALATLLGGVWVAAIYWVIHHSTLRPPPPQPPSTGEPEPPAVPK